MKITADWIEASRGGITVDGMTGGEAQMFDKGLTGYTTRFDCPAIHSLPGDPWVLLDCGSNRRAFASKTYLNGTFLSEIFSGGTSLRFCIPAKSLKPADNVLTIVFFGNFRMAWLDNGDQTEIVTQDDLTPEPCIRIEPFTPAGAVTRVDPSGNRIALETASGIRIECRFPVNGTARITVRGTACNPDPLINRLLPLGSLPGQPCTVTEHTDTILIQSATAGIRVDRQNGQMSLLRADGQPVGSPFRVLTAGDTTLLTWPLHNDEHLFGLGENTTGGMDKRGTLETIWVIHSFDRCDKPIPFLLSTAGYGLYLHSSYRADFDLGKSIPDQAACLVDHPGLDVVLFNTPRFPDMIRHFTDLTGHSPLPPRWAFGFWQSTTRRIPQDELEQNIDRFDAEDIPIDVIAIDPNWQAPGFQSWEWDTRQYFPQPDRFLQKLKQAKLELALWTCPFINRTSPLFSEAEQYHRLMLEPDGSTGKVGWWMGHEAGLVDFADDPTAQWWGRKAAKLADDGVHVFKVDGGDSHETPSYLNSVTGRSMTELHNLYPVLFAKSVYEGIQRSDQRTLTWIRTGFSGIQQYPCCWGGDQKADFSGGRILIKAGQQSGLAGISFWSHDVGGFGGTPTEEYYIRSFQWGLLSPLSRAHGSITAPWNMGERACRIAARFIRLRYRLLPLIYSYAWHSHITGEPMMRAMVLDYQDDPNARQAEFQYTLGPDLLIAPIYQESDRDDLAATRSLYLPEGTWWDFWTDERRTGRQTLAVEAPIDSLPLVVRGGAILVYGEPVRRASQPQNRLELHLYAGGNGTLDYYEDDGRTQAYRTGERAITSFHLEDTGEGLSLNISPTNGTFNGQSAELDLTLVVHGMPNARSATVNGQSAPVRQIDGKPSLAIIHPRNTTLQIIIR